MNSHLIGAPTVWMRVPNRDGPALVAGHCIFGSLVVFRGSVLVLCAPTWDTDALVLCHFSIIFYTFTTAGARMGCARLGLHLFEYIGFAMVYAILVRHQSCGDAMDRSAGVSPPLMTCRLQKVASALFIIKCSMAS